MNNRPWLRNYPYKGILVNIDTTGCQTRIDFLKGCLQIFKIERFPVYGQKMTYNEADRLSRGFRAYLHSRRLKPGDRTALMIPNLLQYPIAVFGALKAGLIHREYKSDVHTT
ncbi:MAG: AMP-binding protein [Saprospiraceae bacterium]|nr:AMP-binding protein [Saprospiraceae bacterium]